MNNGFLNYIVDTETKQFINKPKQPNIDSNLNHKRSINMYYKKQFHYKYKTDEQILKNLIHKNVLPTDLPQKFDLLFTTRNLKPPT